MNGKPFPPILWRGPSPFPLGRPPAVLLARRRFLALLASTAALSLPDGPARSQGFAGLGSGGGGFALPQRGRVLTFPQDHLPHPEFRIEWWYLTANLRDEAGRPWGVQWTLFRSALTAGAPEEQAWMGHAALTSAELHLTSERLARPGQAGVALIPSPGEAERSGSRSQPEATLPPAATAPGQQTAEPGDGASVPKAWIDEWQMSGDPEAELSISAGGEAFHWELSGQAAGSLVLQGDQGYSVKSGTGSASHYYSQPFLRLSGTAQTRTGTHQLSGIGWLDREWSSEPLAEDQTGWDWFSLSFDSGDKMMAFTVRGASPYRTAAWISAEGQIETLPPGSLHAEPTTWANVRGHDLPIRHRLILPAKGLDIEVSALRSDCWMPLLVAYWEGPVRVTGSHQGVGYLEMTGYDRR